MYKKKHLNIFSLRKPTPYPVATGLVTAVLGILAVILGRKKTQLIEFGLGYIIQNWKRGGKYRLINREVFIYTIFRIISF